MSPCPFCGGAASVRHEHDEDGCRWTFIACNKCGVRTRGKWVSHSSDECPRFYEEVREEWNQRTPQTAGASSEAVAYLCITRPSGFASVSMAKDVTAKFREVHEADGVVILPLYLAAPAVDYKK